MTDTEPNVAAGPQAHPHTPIPLPDHGFETLDDGAAIDAPSVPAAEVITRAAVLLLSSAAERLALSSEGEPDLDLDQVRPLITALAGLLAASEGNLGEQADTLRDGLQSLQIAFREASRYPDAPGEGPGEALLS